MEDVQPQTIELEDGFPMENMKFCGSAQEVMAIIQKNKPMAMAEIDKDYKRGRFVAIFIKDGQEIVEDHDCKQYTYDQVYKASKSVNLVYYPFPEFKKPDNGYIRKIKLFFLKENMKDAYILWKLWKQEEDYGMENTEETYNIKNTIIGILLGYKKKDIRAWFVMKLQHEFDMDFNNIDQRSEFIQKPEFKKRRDEIASEFEKIYEKATKKLDEIRKEETVPESWSSQLKTLEQPPKKSLKERLFGKKGGKTIRRNNNRKTLRRRK